MKYLVLICIAIILGGGVYLLLRDTSWPITNAPPKNDTIVAFGDSLVVGEGSTAGNDFVSRLTAETGYDILNLGVRGNTTEDGLARLDKVLVREPGLVVLLLGGNDALRRIPLETTRANLEHIITRVHLSGSVVLLVGVRGGLLGDPYEDMYAEIAEAHQTAFVPNILEGILLRPELTADQIHPNDAGYEIVAERIGEVLLPLLDAEPSEYLCKSCEPIPEG